MLAELEEDVRHIVHEWFGKDAWVCETAGFERAQLGQRWQGTVCYLKDLGGRSGNASCIMIRTIVSNHGSPSQATLLNPKPGTPTPRSGRQR